MKMKNMLFLSVLLFCALGACGDNDASESSVGDMSGFAKGADVSWLTEMESAGKKFYKRQGNLSECMSLLRSLGMNSVRLRVWVDPAHSGANGWCDKNDLLVKALRARDLGMRVMVDFHYSDWWADPGQQTVPAAWTGYNLDQMKQAVANHTTDVLTLLKDNGVTPEWVQVGNETGNGMLWEQGKASTNMAGYAALNNAGYDAVKSVFPEAIVIVHVHNGDDNGLFRWLFDGLKDNGGKWDMIGMSLYPEKDTWRSQNDKCIANIDDMIARYSKPVMICEVGMNVDLAQICRSALQDLIGRCKAVSGEMCRGVFYWEPEAYGGWKSYGKGAFDEYGKPTVALDAFK